LLLSFSCRSRRTIDLFAIQQRGRSAGLGGLSALLSGCSAADMPLLFLAGFSAKSMLFQEVRCFPGDFSAGNSGGATVRPLSASSA